MYTMRRGGAYDRFRMMLEAFLERGCKVHCLSLTPIRVNHQGYQNHVLRIPIKVRETFIAKMVVLSLFPLYALWIGRQEKIDLFIAFGTLYAFIESLPKWILRKPMVTFLRGNFAFGMQTQGRFGLLLWLNHWIEKIGIHFSDSIISVNSTIQEEMTRAAGRKKGQRWEVLPNNIPPMPVPEYQNILQKRKMYGIPEDAKLLVTAGVINRGKNIELLIECLHQIGLNNIYFLIVGDGSTEADSQYQNYLRKLVKNLNLSNRVIFTGTRRRSFGVYSAPVISSYYPHTVKGCQILY
jgi:glycosyltransferase involved in cell wall biosynthesis